MRDPVLNNPNLLVKPTRRRIKLQPYLNYGLIGLGGIGFLFLIVALFLPGRESLPDFSAYQDTDEKKAAFFNYIHERVEEINDDITNLRGRLLTYREDYVENDKLSGSAQNWIREKAIEYKFEDTELVNLELIDNLLQRADIVPPSLVLSQAALESAWGSSRFAREGNNLFGMRCWTPGCGIVPKRRAPGATFEVASYRTPLEGIKDYVHNINTNNAYLDLRRIRARLRDNNDPVTGYSLAGGLYRYSEQGGQYVDKVRNVILANDLARFDS